MMLLHILIEQYSIQCFQAMPNPSRFESHIYSMQLSTKISGSVSLFLVVAMLLSTSAFVMQGYINFKNNIRTEAENSLIIFQALHIQAMLNRGTSEDNNPVIKTLDGTLEQLSKQQDRFALWAVMGPKVVAYQQHMGHLDLELPKDDVDLEALNTGKIIGRMEGANMYRLSVPIILGQEDATYGKCFECHGEKMGIKKGEVIGAYSIAMSDTELWTHFLDITKSAIIIAIFISILVSALNILLLNRIVSGPITKITALMRRLADGDTRVETHSITRNDEIGKMESTLEIFKDNVVELNFQKYALDEHAIVSSTDVKGNITYVNDKFCEISGYSRAELLGQNHRILKSDEHSLEFYKDLWGTVGRGKTWHGSVKNFRKDGSEYWVKATVVPFMNDQGKPFQYVSIRTDITEQRAALQLKIMAHYDALTGLPNRNLFGDRLMLAIAQAKRLDAEIAFFYIDLDNFKPINDTLGHDAGDAVLVEVAKRLTGIIRETDTVARIGGDEFAIIMAPPVPQNVSQRTAENILQALSKPISAKGHECTIGASIGISIYPRDANDSEILIKLADRAMYKVKESGRNGFCYHGKNPA